MKKLYRNDLILNIIIVAICIALPVYYLVTSESGEKTVVITCDGKIVVNTSLSSEDTFSINGVEIVIENNTCYVKSSTCPDGLCTKMKAAKKRGDSIICVPQRVSVMIADDGGKAGVDIVVG